MLIKAIAILATLILILAIGGGIVYPWLLCVFFVLLLLVILRG